MGGLTETVRREVDKYAGRALNGNMYSVLDDEHRTYTVLAVQLPRGSQVVRAVVMARIEGDKVIIEEDRTNKPLVEALEQAGIPREKIVLAYAGEAVPEADEA